MEKNVRNAGAYRSGYRNGYVYALEEIHSVVRNLQDTFDSDSIEVDNAIADFCDQLITNVDAMKEREE